MPDFRRCSRRKFKAVKGRVSECLTFPIHWLDKREGKKDDDGTRRKRRKYRRAFSEPFLNETAVMLCSASKMGRLAKARTSVVIIAMQRLSYPTETVLSNKITRNRIVPSFKDCPRKTLRRRPSVGREEGPSSRFLSQLWFSAHIAAWASVRLTLPMQFEERSEG